VTVEVRACKSDELLSAFAPIWHYFGTVAPTEEASARILHFIPPERMHAAWVDGTLAGGAGAFTFRLTVPGGRLPTAGVAAVAVLPTHRRRGLLTALMRAQLADVHERGEPLAALWSADERIYGRFGYGMASLCGELELPRQHSALASSTPFSGKGRLAGADEPADAFVDVYERVAAFRPGMLRRSREWWELRILDDRPERRAGGGELARLLVEVDGKPEGYALYRLHTSFEAGVSTGSLNVVEAMGTTPEATRDVWRTLLELDWIDRIKARLLPVDHELFLLLAEPRRMRFRVGDALWVRLVDVAAALSGRSYAEDGAVVFEVADELCPWNTGRWKLEGGEAVPTEAEPDLRCEVHALGSVYLGGFTFAQLQRAGRIEEARAGGVARADALFRSDCAPWCPEIF
jgi:predicted acetyltransferase